MRVLICATEYYPSGSGIANVAYNVVRELELMGVKCTVCSPTGPDIILGDPKKIQKFGILGMLYYWHQVSRHFRTNDFDVVWLHNPLFLGRNPFKKCLVTMHITLNGVYRQKISKSIFLRKYKHISSKIESYCHRRLDTSTNYSCVSPTVRDELKEMGIPYNKIKYIPNGVDINRFSPKMEKGVIRDKFSLLKSATIFLCVGRLSPQKRPFTLIEVFSLLENRLGDAILCIAGKGELFEATKDLAEKRGLHKIRFLGYVNDYDLSDLYACSDYYIMTSVYEGLPLTLLEAMASGLPCIVSDIPNLKIVKEADCGIIVNFEDIAIASEQIIEYTRKKDTNHSQNSREYVITHHDWHLISEQYLKEFLSLQR